MQRLTLIILILILILGIGFMVLYQMGYLEQFFLQEGDTCEPEGTADSNATYTIDADGECVFTCKSEYKKSGDTCIEDTTGDACTTEDMDDRGTYVYNASGTCALSSCSGAYDAVGTSCVKKLPNGSTCSNWTTYGKVIRLLEIEVYNQEGDVISSEKDTTGAPVAMNLNNLVDTLYQEAGVSTVTSTEAEYPYIQIDLDSLQQISSIKITSSAADYAPKPALEGTVVTTVQVANDSLKNAIVKLFAADGTTVTAATPPTNTLQQVAVYDFTGETPAWTYSDL